SATPAARRCRRQGPATSARAAAPPAAAARNRREFGRPDVPAPASRHQLTGYHHIQLVMPPGEEPRAEAFYSGLLGLPRVEKPPELAARGGCWFRGDGIELHLGVEDEFRPNRKAH